MEPTFADIRAAADRVREVAVETPLLRSPALDATLGGRILLKAESLQYTGSFKIRGAYNFISQLDVAARRAGIVAYSSGNHAQGVAAAARALAAPATIIMPADAPGVKIRGTRAHGAAVVLYDRVREAREEIAAQVAADSGATIVPPYDHPWTIAGQGTVGLELARQAKDVGATLDAVLVPCGGGGLTAGLALALAELCPATKVVAVEPARFDDTTRSLAAGRRLNNQSGPGSICDALLAPTPGELTFAVNRRLVSGGLVVDDTAVSRAMAYAFFTLKLVVEPGGAAALAAALTGMLDCRGRTIAIVLSGGNVDPAVMQSALGASADQESGS